MKNRVNISDRVAGQLPEFIREEDQKFVDFLVEYYKSQEKIGKPFNILNNLTEYLDLDEYDQKVLDSSTKLLDDVGVDAISQLNVESVDGFLEKDGTVRIDSELFYYEQVRRGPDAVLTPGISLTEYNKKKQQLENIYSQLDGTRQVFQLRYLNNPVTVTDANHLIVTIYGQYQTPNVDYTIDGSNIEFFSAPPAPSGSEDQGTTSIEYLIGYADDNIVTLDQQNVAEIPFPYYDYPLEFAGDVYQPISEIGLIIFRNRQLLVPYTDYITYTTGEGVSYVRFTNALSGSEDIRIRSIEYIAPEFGSGATAIAKVAENGGIAEILVDQGGSGYQLGFTPKVTITAKQGGSGAAAKCLVSGIKDPNLINGGQGYTSANPPIIEITPPSDPNGTVAEAELTVDDATGQVNSVTIKNSGSGYDFIPSLRFVNPSGAELGPVQIDSEGRIDPSSLTIVAGGQHYKTSPQVYIDPAPDSGINASAYVTLTEGAVTGVYLSNPGRGYTTPPRIRIVQPVGAQVLGVTVTNNGVTDIELLTGGRGYTDAPSIYIVDDRKDPAGVPVGGSGATAVATIFNGELTDIQITNFGSGYDPAFPPKIFIAEPLAAQASVNVGFNEVTGFEIVQPGKDYVPSSLLGVKRGVSGVIDFDQFGNQVFATEAQTITSSHATGSDVINLDAEFIKVMFDKFARQYLPNIKIDYSKVNPVQVIKTIQDYYVSKGTKTATQYLFKILFGEEVDVFYPKDEVIVPSAANWSVDTVVRATLISGDPRNLIDGQLTQFASDVDQNVGSATALIENVISIIKGGEEVYELAISEETLAGQFVVPYKTNLVEPLTATNSIITVDSTIGWPERNGTIRINDEEEVQYKEKSLNQFIECTRSVNNVVSEWDAATIVQSDIYCYVNRGTATECKLRLLGIAEAGATVLNDTGSYYLEGDKLTVAKFGSSVDDIKLTSWLYNVKKLIRVDRIESGGLNNQEATVYCDNPHGLLVSDQVTIYGANPIIYNGTFSVTSRISEKVFSYRLQTPAPTVTNPETGLQEPINPIGDILLSVDLNRGKSNSTTINNVVSLFTSNIQNTYFNDNYVYVASSGLPNYKVGPFEGSALIPGNQRKLLRIPRNVQTVSTRPEINPNISIATFINGVSAWSYRSEEFVNFGPLTGITINNTGSNYDAGSPPAIIIEGGGGSGAEASVVVNGGITSFVVTDGGSGYTSSPLISIVGGNGTGATAQAVVTNGTVSRILVDNPGTGYTTQPTIAITGGGGSGATATANVRGPIKSISLTNAGEGYTSVPSIKLDSGSGAVAQPIVINGRIVSIAIINSGSGYTTPPNVIINGEGFGAVATATIGTFGEDKGKVISVSISNRGINYVQGSTVITLESVGSGAEFEATIFKWNKNLEYQLASKYDRARGYVFTGYNNQFGGEYAHISDPKELRYVVGDNVTLDVETNQFSELEVGFGHSPIIGWAFDGNPIYGPYGHGDPTSQSSAIRRMVSSYALKPSLLTDDDDPTYVPVRSQGPSLTEYPAGSFVADYEYNFQSGDLDEFNGRFCVTPEFPNGVYAYFITIDATDAGNPVFPYIIGPQYYSSPDSWNFTQNAIQEYLPTGIVRYRDPFEDVDIDIDRTPNQRSDNIATEAGELFIFELEDLNRDDIIDATEQQTFVEMIEESALQIFDYFPKVSTSSRVDIEVETTARFEDAKIDGFVVENPGKSYQVNDIVSFNNEGTGGFGASAVIESVKGKAITAYTSGLDDDVPYGEITTDINHDLLVGDEVIISSTPIPDNTNKTFETIVVSGVENVNILEEGLGYNSDVLPTYELITSSGQDADIRINLETTGQINKIDIVNSGTGYDVDNPPEVRVSHPQQLKKTRYWVATSDDDNNGKFDLNYSFVNSKRQLYVCGSILLSDGNRTGYLAKYDDLGNQIWERKLMSVHDGVKTTEFTKFFVVESETANDLIYVTGQTYPNTDNDLYNPDIFLGLYESGVDNANNPSGILKWQKEIAGISGSTRADYVTAISVNNNGQIYLGGYTNTNSTAADDIWVIQCNEDGDLEEKRKFASASGDERLYNFKEISENVFLFVGLNGTTNNPIFGQFTYDGANLELAYAKEIAIGSNECRNPDFITDEYDSMFIVFEEYNAATDKIANYTLYRIDLDDTDDVLWSRQFTTSESYLDMALSGISLDIFGNINVVVDIKFTEERRVPVLTNIKYDGSVLRTSYLEDTDTVGIKAKNHTVDNSGDIILLANRQQPNQIAVYRFDGFGSTTKGFITSIDNVQNNAQTRGASVATVDTISAADQLRATNIGTVNNISAADVRRAGVVTAVDASAVVADERRTGFVTDVNNISAANTTRGGIISGIDTISGANALRGGAIGSLGAVTAGTVDATRTQGVYPGIAGTFGSNGKNATFIVTVDVNGDVTNVAIDNPGISFTAAESITITPAQLTTGSVDIVLSVDTITSPGTYTGVSQTSTTGSGTGATFDITVDVNGAATIAIPTGGRSYIVDETITIADADIGGGGAPDLTFDVSAVTGITYTGVATTTNSANGTGATFDVVIDGVGAVSLVSALPGNGYLVGDQITIADSDLGGTGAPDVTATISTTIGKTWNGVNATAVSPSQGINLVTNVTLDEVGVPTITVTSGGSGYLETDQFTIADADIGNYGAADLTVDVTTTSGATYNTISTWSVNPSGGTGAVFNAVVDNVGAVTLTVAVRGQGFTIGDTITIPNTQLGGFAGGPDLTFDVATIEGHTYTNVASTNNANGVGATFDIVIDGTGAASSVTPNSGGYEYKVGNTITITDANIGNFGAADLTFNVATLAPFTYERVATTSSHGGSGATIDVTVDSAGVVTVALADPGELYGIDEVISIPDANVGGFDYDVITVDVAGILDFADETKQDFVQENVYDGAAATLDAVSPKFGASSLKFTSPNHLAFVDLGKTSDTFMMQAWFKIDSTQHAVNHEPVFISVGSEGIDPWRITIDGDQTSPDYEKVKLYEGSDERASSAGSTYWTTIGDFQWHLVTFVKENPSTGNYRYRVYFDGTSVLDYLSIVDTGINDVYIGGSATPTASNGFIGNIDEVVIEPSQIYTADFTPSTSEYAVTTDNASAFYFKFDRQGSLHGYDFSADSNSQFESLVYNTYTNTNYTFTENPAITISDWSLGAGGLQILDYNDVTAILNEPTVTLTHYKELWSSRTATVPSPLGKKLRLTLDVIPKFYFKDASYTKIDNVKEFTLSQPVQYSKGSIFQQYNSSGVVQAFGTIVEVPSTDNGLGTKYKVGKIFGTFNTSDLIGNDLLELNEIEDQTYIITTPESPWETGRAYNVSDRVYNDGNIYEATSAGTSGTIPPTHTAGSVSDGVVVWSFVSSAGIFDIDLSQYPWPESGIQEWESNKTYAEDEQVRYLTNVYSATGSATSGSTAPTHTSGSVSDGGVTWEFVETLTSQDEYARFKGTLTSYTVQIVDIYPGSEFIVDDVINTGFTLGTVNGSDDKILRISGLDTVKSIRVITDLTKDTTINSEVRTDLVFCDSSTRHNYAANDIIYTTGFTTDQFNGSFFVKEVFNSRDFIYQIRDTATSDPAFNNGSIGSVKIYAKHPTFLMVRDHQYVFDVSDPSNSTYFLSFSEDNQYKLEYTFNNIRREGTPGVAGSTVQFKITGDVTNISYYFDPSRLTSDKSPVGNNSFIDIINTPYSGTYSVNNIVADNVFRFNLSSEPEQSSAIVADDDQGNPYSAYATTSTRAIGPINTIKIISQGGFYKKLPVVADIASNRKIEGVNIVDAGSEYAVGVYTKVPIDGDGEGGLVSIEVTLDPEIGSGVISSVTVTDPGKGYTTASIDIEGIPGILGAGLTGSGGELQVVIPDEGSGASVFLTGSNVGKIKKLKNNEFGYGYSHDYTLRPEITFPINLQLFNTSILSQIKVTNPGSGYTAAPAVVITGGGGSGAEGEAIVRNNRLSEIIIKNPGSGYSSEPTIELKSEFNYVVNLDLNYLQFNFPHGITQGAEIEFRADDQGTTVGVLPQPSTAGLTSLVEGQIYYAIVGAANGLESDQIRFALTPAAAASGDFITFLTQGSGKQVLLTEVFGGEAEAVVETSRFLEGEVVYQGDSLDTTTATATISTNTGWQIGPKILKLVNVEGEFVEGATVTGLISKASGLINNINLARGVLTIDAVTRTPGKFTDDVGKPSVIVQKIQDSFFYQSFSYVIKSELPISRWKTTLLDNNHPVGFNMFGQLQLTGGKDISGRKVSTDFIKQVNISDFTNVNEITSFAAAEPVYSDFNNTEILFRQKRLTSSEEILTSIVKKIDDISGDFDGVRKVFPLTVEGETLIANENQLLITINGIIQSPGNSFTTQSGSIVFDEPPKPASKIRYTTIDFTPLTIYRLELDNISGIFPELGDFVNGFDSDARARVVSSATTSIDVVDVVDGPFVVNEFVTRGSVFSARIIGISEVPVITNYRFGEAIQTMDGQFAIIEENNVDADGDPTNTISVSRTSGTAEYETGEFDIGVDEIFYSAGTNIAARVTSVSPYRDPVTNAVVSELIINQGSSFFGLVFERLISTTNPNVIIDDISKTSVAPAELYNTDELINDDFLNFEEVRSTELVFDNQNIPGLLWETGDEIKSKEISYLNIQNGPFTEGETLRSIKIAYKDKSAGLFNVDDVITGISSGATTTVKGFNTGLQSLYTSNISGGFTADEYITNSVLDSTDVVRSEVQKKSGTHSLKFISSSSMSYPSSDKVAFGTDDYTIEFWARFDSVAGTQYLFDLRQNATDTVIGLYTNGTDLELAIAGSAVITGTGAIAAADTWYHIAITRTSTTTKLFVDGAQVGSNYTDSNDYAADKVVYISNDFQGGNDFSGYIDNFMIKKGQSDYGAAFTPVTTFDADDETLSLGINAEQPIVILYDDVYAKFSSREITSATLSKLKSDDSKIIIEDVDLSRDSHRASADIIELNADFIAEEVVGKMKARYGDFTYPTQDDGYGLGDKCVRDTKEYIIDAIVKDLRNGGNFYAVVAGRGYLEANEIQFVGKELLQTVYTYQEVATLAKDVVTNLNYQDLSGDFTNRLRIPSNFISPAQTAVTDEIDATITTIIDILAPTGHRFRDAGDLLWFNREYIAEEAVGHLNTYYNDIETATGATYDFLTYGPNNLQSKCERDIKEYIIPAIISDLLTGGNGYTQNAIDFYLDSDENITSVEDQLNPMLYALDITKKLCQKAVNNLLTPPETESILGSIPEFDVSLPAGTFDDDFYSPAYTQRGSYNDFTITRDTKGVDPTRNELNNYIDAANQIERNIDIIAYEVVHEMNDTAKFQDLTIPGGSQNCIDDVKGYLEAVVHDIRFGGNERVYDASELYLSSENTLAHIESESEASIYTYKLARDVVNLTIRNAFGAENKFDNIGITTGYDQNGEEPDKIDAALRIERNIRFIAEEAVARGLVQYPSLSIPGGNINCIHDVADVLRALVFNLQNGGNNKVYYAAEFYLNSGALAHVSAQATETVWIFNEARDLAIDIVNGTPISVVGSHGYTVDTTASSWDAYTSDPADWTRTESGINILMGYITDTIQDPTGADSATYPYAAASNVVELPTIWPVKYSNNKPERDFDITYDPTAQFWIDSCTNQVSAVNSLFDVVINTIESAVGGVNYLDTITRTTGYDANIYWQQYACYDVTSAIESLFSLYPDTLGAGGTSKRQAAEKIHFNRYAIRQRAYDATLLSYPTYAGNVEFADNLLDALIYDLITGGNAKMIDTCNQFFDGQGNYNYEPNVIVTHLLYHEARIREFAKEIITDFDSTDWNGYDIYTGTANTPAPFLEFEPESASFAIDSSMNLVRYSLSRADLPTNNRISFIPSSDVTNQSVSYQYGTDVVTDPNLSSINPAATEVGWDRQYETIKITTAHQFRRGDVLTYIPAQSGGLADLSDQSFYYVIDTTTTYFVIARAERHDARYRDFSIDTANTATHFFALRRRDGVERAVTTNGTRSIPTAISAGFAAGDVFFGTSSGATAEFAQIIDNFAEVVVSFWRLNLTGATGEFINGEELQVVGSPSDSAKILRAYDVETDNTSTVDIVAPFNSGNFSVSDVVTGIENSYQATIASIDKAILIRIKRGSFLQGDPFFRVSDTFQADIQSITNHSGALLGTEGGVLNVSVETLTENFVDNEVIYGSVTESSIELVDIQGTSFLNQGDILQARQTVKLTLQTPTTTTVPPDTFRVGDEVFLLDGTVIAIPGIRGVVVKYDDRPDDGIRDLYIANLDIDNFAGVTEQSFQNRGVGKFVLGQTFPTIRAIVSQVTVTSSSAYGTVVKYLQTGNTGRVWLENVSGTIPDYASLVSDNGYKAAGRESYSNVGRCKRFFRGFDGTQTSFKLTINNGEQYFPDPDGHMMIFINGILQPPGGSNAFTAFSDVIQFTEPPELGAEFIGFYLGKLKQLDDISFEFDSLQSSFNLRLNGIFYSLTLTEGVSSNVIRPENNIIVSLNGVLQEPGVGFEIVGSRIIFAEVPRAGSTFVAFSYVGSDADVIAATVIPPVEVGDQLIIEGEDPAIGREVALIESSNSLVTFEYTGTVKGRNALATAEIVKGQIDTAILTSGGEGYTSRPIVNVVSSVGFDGRVNALMGVQRIEVQNSGSGYALPVVQVENTVDDDFTTPVGAPVNNGFDIFAGEAVDPDGNPIIVEVGAITIESQPINVTVNQGQTANFTIVANVSNTSTLNYQWQRKNYGETSWSNITAATSPVYTTPAVDQGDDGDEYRCALTALGAAPLYTNSAVLGVSIGATEVDNFNPEQVFDDP